MNNKEILDNAPDSATHWDYGGDYVRYNSSSDRWEFCDIDTGAWVPTRAIEGDIRALADIKRIDELETALIILLEATSDIYCNDPYFIYCDDPCLAAAEHNARRVLEE